jgi:hypothetical protein
MADQSGARGAALEGRNGEIYRKYTVYRWTQAKIAEHYGIAQSRVHQIIKAVQATIPKHDLAEMRQQSLELYAELTARALEIADLVPAPVFVGKDGAIAYDEDGNVVRDYSGKLRAMETAARFDQETRKLMGLDAASKSEVMSQVKYEIVGLSSDDIA